MKTEEERRPGGIGKLKRSQTAELEETAERKAGKTAKPEKAGGGQTGETAEIQGDGKRKGAGSFSRIVLRRAAADVISIKWAILLIGVCFPWRIREDLPTLAHDFSLQFVAAAGDLR